MMSGAQRVYWEIKVNRAQLLVVLSFFVIGCEKSEYQIDERAVIWDGGGDGLNWSDPANWTTDLVPTADDHVVVRGTDVMLDQLVTVNAGAELHVIDARLTISPNMVLSNRGLVRLDNGKIFTDQSGSFLNEGDVGGLGDVVFACNSDSSGDGGVSTGVTVETMSCTTCVDANFDYIPAGTQLMSQYSGFTLTAINASGGPDKAIVFDSLNPTGDDTDLRTPGTGIGNDTALGGLAIIAENDSDSDGDGLVDDPDDNAAGGTLVFDFACSLQVTEVSLVDIEEQNANIELINFVDHDADPFTPPILDIVHTATVPSLDDNSVQTIDLSDAPFAVQMRVNLPGSGAVNNVNYCIN
jgi:hypothetical protein